MSKQAGGLAPPGQTWGASDTREESFPGGGNLPVGFHAPIPLSERKPGPEDCLEIKSCTWTMHYCWLGYSILHAGIERLIWDWKPIPFAIDRGWERFTYWLPASTKYLPARVQP